jgi:DNA-binding transcriptional ArsR family regulator
VLSFFLESAPSTDLSADGDLFDPLPPPPRQSAAHRDLWLGAMSQHDSLESNHCAEMLKALGDPIRLRIIDTLRAGPQNVGELAEALATEIATVSHHLGILHAAGLVEREKRGRFKVYRLREGILASSPSRQGKQHIDLGCCRLEIPTPDQ